MLSRLEKQFIRNSTYGSTCDAINMLSRTTFSDEVCTTALLESCVVGNVVMVKYLLDNEIVGADIMQCIALAIDNDNHDVVELLNNYK